ncbi:MAG: hypothetical protein K2K21_11835 [Lachnospiraceae bacterium]|nr:hypothetical protein [Lachnospiraceae bacterium]
MKRLLSICIVLAILRITYQYTETVGVYSVEVTKGQMVSTISGDCIEAVKITVKINRIKKAPDIYCPLLAEYERAWKDKDYYDEYGFIMSDSRFEALRNSSNLFGHKSLCYALADLADDGSVELVIGVQFDDEYIITTVYSYEGDSIYCADTGVDGDRTLYEAGIYEVFIGMRGVALFDYYQFL